MRIRTYSKPILSETKINSKIKFIGRVYFILIILHLLYFVSVIISLIMGETLDKTARDYSLESLITLVVYITIFVGLKIKKKWVVQLALIGSSFWLIRILFSIATPSENIEMVAQKIIYILLLFFCIYQLSFFSRQEVKSYFNEQGVIFFQ